MRLVDRYFTTFGEFSNFEELKAQTKQNFVDIWILRIGERGGCLTNTKSFYILSIMD